MLQTFQDMPARLGAGAVAVMHRQTPRAPDAVPRLWPESTIVCLGSGPSLTQDDVDACRGRARVIAINDSHRLAPWADVLYATDAKWWKFYCGVPAFHGLKFAVMDCEWEQDGVPWPDLRVLKNCGVSGLELNPTGLRNGKNSGYAAVNVAVHLGASRILLLGYDMGKAPDGKVHFFGEHPDALQASSPYVSFIEMFATLVKPLQQCGVEVINCTRRTALTCFPQRPLEAALAGARL